MKSLKDFIIGMRKRVSGFCLLLAVALVISQSASAATTTISQNNSSINFDFGSSAGMKDWFVDGVDQLNQQSFWYRLGNVGPQLDLTSITAAPTITPFGTRN